MAWDETPKEPEDGGDGRRYFWIHVILLVAFVVIVGRLWILQVAMGDEFLRKSETNHTRLTQIPTTRGLIKDRDGRVLVDNSVSYELLVTPKEVGEPAAQEDLSRRLGALLSRDPAELLRRFHALRSKSLYEPGVWINDLTRADIALLETRRLDFMGLAVRVNSMRKPLSGNFAPHVIGYLGEISKAQLESGRFPGLSPGDLIGQAGIEQSMDSVLQGEKGQVLMNVDSRGRLLEELEKGFPTPGRNVTLTLDSRMQRVAQALLAERAGAIVVMDPNNFEILALASSPYFNLDDFTGGVSRERWRSLMEDPFHPMENRAVGGQYPPGSTFKIAMSISALSEGVITPETVFHCGGALRMGDHLFGCWNRRGHGSLSLHRSLKESCDVYYYEVGRRMGVDRIAKNVRRFFGLGRTLGVDLQTERPGLVPDQDWKMRRFKAPWNAGETLPVSIGQGYLLATPLQVAQYTAVAANGGTLMRPHLVMEISDFEGRLTSRVDKEIINQLGLNPDYLDKVRKGMEGVVNDPGGTGRRAQVAGVRVAGKTGTSQVVSLKRFQGYTTAGRPYKFRDHAWYTAYAPAENPEVVVTVLLEHTGGGGTNAGPIAGKVLAAWFDKGVDAQSFPPFQVQPDKPVGWKGDL
ncbi:MAG: penicillin-binding protein 2 [Deltaproteobacteria bacterium]|jgi:penicillin-binding protein 2|nr:penicillin-binding protein 2 [Deltaproteobacteria bacterium]